MIFELVVKSGQKKGKHYILNDIVPVKGGAFAMNDGITTIGRGIENDIPVNDPKVSRRHCQIKKGGAFYKIKDLDSKNKTKLNGQDIDEATLNIGDEITLGDTVFTVIVKAALEKLTQKSPSRSHIADSAKSTIHLKKPPR